MEQRGVKMLVINIVVVVLFLVLGILFAKGKGLRLVAGYNTMSEKEKENVNPKVLCKYMARLMFLLAACWCVLSVGMEIEKMWLFWVGFGLFLAVAMIFVIYMNTGNRLKKET